MRNDKAMAISETSKRENQSINLWICKDRFYAPLRRGYSEYGKRGTGTALRSG